MAKGSSQGQAAVVPRGGSASSGAAGAVQRAPPPGVVARGAGPAGLRRRRPTSSASSGGASNMLRFYTDDAPGLKISPHVVLVMSICFIGFVAVLHGIGKIYGTRTPQQ